MEEKRRKEMQKKQGKGKSALGDVSHAATHSPRFCAFRKYLVVALYNPKT